MVTGTQTTTDPPSGIPLEKWQRAIQELRSARERVQGDPGYRAIIDARGPVLAKYGSMFRPENLDRITRDDVRAFLSFKENRHWTGLERVSGRMTEDFDLVRRELRALVDPTQPLGERYERFVTKVKWSGRATTTPFLLVTFPQACACWNDFSSGALKKVGLDPPDQQKSGAAYEAVNTMIGRLSTALGMSLWDLDALFFAMDPFEKRTAAPVSPLTSEELPLMPPQRSPERAPLNLILYGPPGTGKTWRARRAALEICGHVGLDGDAATAKFRELVYDHRIGFVTFHQSFSYEDFVEGIRPETTEEGPLAYETSDGIFKDICERARQQGDSREITKFGTINAGFWKVSLGRARKATDAPLYQDCIEKGRIRIGYGGDLDYTGCDDAASILEKFNEATGRGVDRFDFNVQAVDRLKNQMEDGDFVFVSDALSGVRAIGRVIGEYEFLKDVEGSPQSRPVEWLKEFKEPIPREQLLHTGLAQVTIYRLRRPRINLDKLFELIRKVDAPWTPEPCVLVIDEINRANVSKVLGELITLLEPDKRVGAPNEIMVTLPYSRKPFGIPSNVYVIGTMNTADRSLAFLDVALRRRFEFEYVGPSPELLKRDVGGIDLSALLESINGRVEFLLDRDHSIGHAYFMDVTTLDDLKVVFRTKVLPLLEEYFQGDTAKAALCLRCRPGETPETKNPYPIYGAEKLSARRVLGAGDDEIEDRVVYRLSAQFKQANGQALVPFFKGILEPTGAHE